VQKIVGWVEFFTRPNIGPLAGRTALVLARGSTQPTRYAGQQAYTPVFAGYGAAYTIRSLFSRPNITPPQLLPTYSN
jgi:hypothetical protein